MAILAAKQGANVTIIARDVKKLEKVKNQLQHSCKNKDTQIIQYLSLDVAGDFETVEKSFGELEKTGGPIFMLVNCAGTAICGKIEDASVEDLKYMWKLNFLGTFQCIKAVVPQMKKSRDGIIVLTGSLSSISGKKKNNLIIYKNILNYFIDAFFFFLLLLLLQEYLECQVTAAQNLHSED